MDFVDFGDAEEKSIGEVCYPIPLFILNPPVLPQVFSLKTEFLKLKFQAVECTLAGVRFSFKDSS